MPYSTSNSPGLTEAANALTRIFVGDPAGDAELRSSRLKDQTEFQRQRLLQEQVVSEGIQRKQMEAAAAANYAQAAKYGQETDRIKEKNSAFKNIGDLFTGLPDAAGSMPQVQSVRNDVINQPGFLPTPEMAVPIEQATTAAMPAALDAAMPNILANLFTGEMDPKMLSAVNAMPGLSDDQIARNLVASGQTIGKDDYVSLDDRNNNRRFEVGAGERLMGSDGAEFAPLAPSFVDNLESQVGLRDSQAKYLVGNLKSQAGLRDSQAKYYDERTRTGGAGSGAGSGKVPKFGNDEVTASLGALAKSMGLKPGQVNGKESYSQGLYNIIGANPLIAQDLMNLAGQVYQQTGGNTASVNQALMVYMSGIMQDGNPVKDYGDLTGTEVLPGIDTIMARLGLGDPAANMPALADEFTGQPDGSNEMDGQTATNPQTGETVIFRNGRWGNM